MSATTTPQPDPRAKYVLERLDELKDKKADFNARAPLIGEVIAPNRDFVLNARPGEIRRRNLRDTTGVMANKRLAAFIYGDLLSPATPWITPRLLARDPTSEEALWFEMAGVKMFYRLSGPGSPIATSLHEAAQDITAYGNNAVFKKRRKGRMPSVKTLPLAQCYWDENAEGETDTFAWEFAYPARIAAREYPNCKKIVEAYEKDPKKILNFVMLCEPRPGPHVRAGAIGARKPWTLTVLWADGKEIVDDSQGYDRFPFQVGRFDRGSGQNYGTGPGWDAYPACFTANAMLESVIRGAELACDPPLFGDAALFGGRIDRRPGAFNPTRDPLAFMGHRVQDRIGKLDLAGDVGVGIEMLNAQRQMIERQFYIDWLWLGDAQMMTATEVHARRDMRMRLLAPIVTRLEQEWLNPLVEDVFFAMLEAGDFGAPPASLASEEIGFTYQSPLAQAQRGAMREAIDRTFDLAAKAHAVDETAHMVLKADEMLREAARLAGVSEKRLRSTDELEAMRVRRAQEAEQQRQAELQAQSAGALQAASQGIASLQAA